ncbi:uncharacterized protein LOC127717256 [Mytilus californianus]|uniref:uncharacterized protein LOC127717256 n=1 Tax=Mytilus californianus TaxID=6549 RepID=UPI00224578D2|nr:uncharacterized protein LOC127717256 [Mytilus californianus]
MTDSTSHEEKSSVKDKLDEKGVEILEKGPSFELSSEMESLEVGSSDQSLEAQSTVRKSTGDIEVTYYLRDIQPKMVNAWTKLFKNHENRVKISSGDIFRGAPEADALVSPANSFGFMDGGIDMVYTNMFGWQMQERLQKVIREDYNGENVVGNAIIIPAYSEEPNEEKIENMKKFNLCGGRPIKFLISAPTMRVPKDVNDTANAFLAFRAIILAVQKHNRDPENQPIRSVLCPGLGTAVGNMPFDRCAFQYCEKSEETT